MDPKEYLTLAEQRDLDRMIDCEIEDWQAAKQTDRRQEDYCQLEFDEQD